MMMHFIMLLLVALVFSQKRGSEFDFVRRDGGGAAQNKCVCVGRGLQGCDDGDLNIIIIRENLLHHQKLSKENILLKIFVNSIVMFIVINIVLRYNI